MKILASFSEAKWDKICFGGCVLLSLLQELRLEGVSCF